MKITTIYDTSVRPDTLGIYVDNALKIMGHEVFHVEPFNNPEFRDGEDLFLFVDDGIPYKIEAPVDNIAYWAVDTHISMANQFVKGQSAKWIFAAQKDGAIELGNLLKKDILWIPLACDVSHFREPSKKEYDISFVGNVNPSLMPDRINSLDVLYKIPNIRGFYGNKSPKDTSDIFAKSKMVFNRSIRNDINMRIFEAMASGSMLLTNNCGNGMDELFDDNECCVFFESDNEIKERVEYFLNHEQEREDIAHAGKILMKEKHTYVHRMGKMLEIIRS